MDFNLCNKAWIEVVDKNGNVDRVSLLQLFNHAHHYSNVVDRNPLSLAATYRLLVVILYRAHYCKGVGFMGDGAKEAWNKHYASGEFNGEIFSDYLNKFEDRFDLFSEDHPFFQSAEFSCDTKTPIKKLSPNYASANNKTLFSHHFDDDGFSVSAAKAARFLLLAQSFSLCGGNGGSSNYLKKHPNYTHAPMVGAAATFILGASIFETLMLNAPPIDAPKFNVDEDKPIWENDNLNSKQSRQITEYEPNGLLDYLTYKSRHIRLLADENNRVSYLYMAQGLQLHKDSIYRHNDPFCTYRITDKTKAEKKPLHINFERRFWRDSQLIYQRLLENTDEVSPPKALNWCGELRFLGRIEDEYSIHVLGLQNDQGGPLSWYGEQLPLNVKLLIADVKVLKGFKDALTAAEDISKAIHSALCTYAKALLDDATPTRNASKMFKAMVKAMDQRHSYWSALQKHYPRMLMSITQDQERAINEWKLVAVAAAEENMHISLPMQTDNAREWRAMVSARKWFDIKMNQLRKEVKEDAA